MDSSSGQRNLFELISSLGGGSPSAAAILAPGRSSLSWMRFTNFITEATTELAALGVRRNDRVALVLPNGPLAATAFLAVSNIATAAPLNPAYSLNEFDFYLTDLHASALVLERSSDNPARSAAEKQGIPVLEITARPDEPAGIFTFVKRNTYPKSYDLSQEQDVALVLHTSGTTSRPKIVPLTHANLMASAANISDSLALTSRDRCLNIMPLFHIHGLMAAVVGSLVSGGSVICTGGMNPATILDWLITFEPTWLTAVPTMLQALLQQVTNNPAGIGKLNLRFIRACSSALPPVVAEKLEDTFHIPVLEAYGMTEASHQIAVNPQPPAHHKLGSVGKAFGDEVAILDEDGNNLTANSTGEICIRGANVMGGYEANPIANQLSFTKGWLRTGDLGMIDEEGYIFIQGRVKEIINKGGEKISPREIDDVLLSHPDVNQAVTFAVPHPTLGEDIAAAVVLHPNRSLKPRQLIDFAAGQLALFKIPNRVLIVQEIPKGPTGKIQRIGLAEKFKDKLEADHHEVEQSKLQLTQTEVELITIWAEVLGHTGIDVHQDFFTMGGDSLRAVQVLSRLEAKFNLRLSVREFFQMPTILEIAKKVDEIRKPKK